ncbi:hypothetical protein JX265_003353 [Neoarthrinium moseri]|uniref:Ribosomal protein S21 n=1 Tax=Neoarthrinium moseri TaxID=1658444 RepID=A0A9P9WS37_9PEZI|nr:hypothetical protein JX265_003353 [Neoarthrinium moseri]
MAWSQRANEITRVAHAAMRSAQGFRTIPSRSYSLLAAQRQPSPSALLAPLRGLSLNASQRRSQADWASPSRRGKTEHAIDAKIRKPPRNRDGTRTASILDRLDADDTGLPQRNIFDAVDDFDYTQDFQRGELDKKRRGDTDSLTDIVANYPSIRCVPRTGRTIQVSKGADVARSFKLLNMQCTANRVRQDFSRQKFHERGGLKRKRLASERWRRRFKKGFQATCKRVDELRRQGW